MTGHTHIEAPDNRLARRQWTLELTVLACVSRMVVSIALTTIANLVLGPRG